MAYVQKPGRGNHAKTGHGIPAPFKQMETLKKIGNTIKEGLKAGDKFFEGKPYYGDTRYNNEDTVFGRRGSGPHAGEKVVKNPKTGKSPAKQTKKKEESFLDKAEKFVSDAGTKVKRALEAGDKFFEGKPYYGDSRYNNEDTVFGRRGSGPHAGEKIVKNPKSGKSPAKQLGKQAVTKVAKKASVKMKKC